MTEKYKVIECTLNGKPAFAIKDAYYGSVRKIILTTKRSKVEKICAVLNKQFKQELQK